MSILAEMLKKADANKGAGEIPPGLRQAVLSGSGNSDGRRYLLVAGLALLLIAAGATAVFFITGKKAGQSVKQQPQPVVAVQPQVSTARLVASVPPAPPVVAAPQPAAETDKPVAKKVKHRRVAIASAPKASPNKPEKQPEAQDPRPVQKERSLIDSHLFAARNAESRRDYMLALKHYQKASEADPHNYRIMNNVASTFIQLRMYEDALTYANRALSIKADYVSALVNAGISQVRLGNATGGRALLVKAVTMEPSNRGALYNLGLVQEQAGALDDALSSFRRLANSGDANGLLGMARINEQRGNRADALRYYRDVLALPDAGQRSRELARERIAILE
jgi:Tfp pilus assembly protein PilF